jgi:hypothetical protein
MKVQVDPAAEAAIELVCRFLCFVIAVHKSSWQT